MKGGRGGKKGGGKAPSRKLVLGKKGIPRCGKHREEGKGKKEERPSVLRVRHGKHLLTSRKEGRGTLRPEPKERVTFQGMGTRALLVLLGGGVPLREKGSRYVRGSPGARARSGQSVHVQKKGEPAPVERVKIVSRPYQGGGKMGQSKEGGKAMKYCPGGGTAGWDFGAFEAGIPCGEARSSGKEERFHVPEGEQKQKK